MKIYLAILFSLIPLFFVEANAEEKQAIVDTSHVYLKANEAYVNSDFTAAVSSYEDIISSGVINGTIFYNLIRSSATIIPNKDQPH